MFGLPTAIPSKHPERHSIVAYSQPRRAYFSLAVPSLQIFPTKDGWRFLVLGLSSLICTPLNENKGTTFYCRFKTEFQLNLTGYESGNLVWICVLYQFIERRQIANRTTINESKQVFDNRFSFSSKNKRSSVLMTNGFCWRTENYIIFVPGVL